MKMTDVRNNSVFHRTMADRMLFVCVVSRVGSIPGEDVASLIVILTGLFDNRSDSDHQSHHKAKDSLAPHQEPHLFNQSASKNKSQNNLPTAGVKLVMH